VLSSPRSGSGHERSGSYDRAQVLISTSERLVPDEQREELLYAEHIARYRFAAQFAAERRALDAGCGEGYGATLLKNAGASSVVGLDVDKEAVEHARERYGLEFLKGDICALPFADSSFDLVVCFETIEHVSDGSRALAEFRRVLTGDGLLIISTPNADQYLVENEFHVREYTPAEFDHLLAEQFAERLWLYQQNWLLSAILDERQFRAADADLPVELELLKVVGLEPGRELYSVVVCGSSGPAPFQVGAFTGIFEAQRLVAELREWQKRSGLAERQRAAWEERATTAERQREAWEERAAEAERQVAEARRAWAEEVQQIESSVSWRLTRPLRFAKALVLRNR
jgi:ubiquinone/menaquinone biosynthesis C-methylase UbiE